MQQLQIARGLLGARRNIKELANGELFIDYTNGGKDNSNTYELYAGINGTPVKLGGQGVLTFIGEITDGRLPDDPIAGGIYIVKEKDIQLSNEQNNNTGKNHPEFKVNDLAIYVGEYTDAGQLQPSISNNYINETYMDILRSTGTFDGDYRGWIRVNNGGGDAYTVTFVNDNTNLKAENLQEAIVELDRTKLSFGGEKFRIGATSADKDLLGDTIISTSSDSDTKIDYSVLAEQVKAGYYYSVGNLAQNSTVTLTLKDGSTITLDEGDFLAVTSNVLTNASSLGKDDLIFTKIAGGTHDSGKINYTVPADGRNETYRGSNDKTWDTLDTSVKNVKEALDDLFKSKADLTRYGKIPLTQLPDTLINSMEYVGAWVIEPENPFTLPTARPLTHSHGDDNGINDEEPLVQGDYFIYSGPQVKISELENLNGTIQSSEGYINSGDWLVYNGKDKDDKADWSVIDNTSPIQSIKVFDNWVNKEHDEINQSTAMAGEVAFQGADRGDTGISETQLEADDKQTVTIHNKNSALIADDDEADVGHFYKESGNKVLKPTGLSENGDVLTIDEANGIVLTGGTKEEDGVTSPINGDASIVQNGNQSSDITITLPAESGTLARKEDVGLDEGTDFFIPRYSDEGDNLKLVDSPIEINSRLNGFTFHKDSSIKPTGSSNDNQVIFGGTGGTETVTHVMPTVSGYILNSNSIIDCGEWTENGLVYEHEGGVNVYHSNSIPDVRTESYKDLILNKDNVTIESTDNQ